jgi:hypothetical protein
MSEQPYRVWFDDSKDFSSRRIERLHHNFDQHPLMQLPQLGELARELMPLRKCRFIRPGTTQASDFWHDPDSPDGRSIEEVIQRIEEPGSWLALYNVEVIPRYQAFLAEAMQSMKPFVERDQSRIRLLTGFIFISAPPSVTPFHIDRENNFWLQIRGRKVMNVWDHRDRTVVPDSAVEEFIINRSLARVRLRDELTARSRQFNVGAGDGVYFPSTSPHMTNSDTSWVNGDDKVSVSIGINFYTDLTRRHAQVHQFNSVIRKLGVSPRGPGESTLVDAMKAPIGHIVGAARYWRRRQDPPPGAY